MGEESEKRVSAANSRNQHGGLGPEFGLYEHIVVVVAALAVLRSPHKLVLRSCSRGPFCLRSSKTLMRISTLAQHWVGFLLAILHHTMQYEMEIE